MHKRFFYGFWLTISVVAGATGALADDRIDFASEIRPILSETCFLCHGPDETQRKADLRLDTRQGALGKRDSGAAFVAGKPDESEAWLRITADDPNELRRFEVDHHADMADDRDNAPVYLSRSAWDLQYTVKKWPKIKFAITRERILHEEL